MSDEELLKKLFHEPPQPPVGHVDTKVWLRSKDTRKFLANVSVGDQAIGTILGHIRTIPFKDRGQPNRLAKYVSRVFYELYHQNRKALRTGYALRKHLIEPDKTEDGWKQRSRRFIWD